MTDTDLTRTDPPRAPLLLAGDSSEGIARARDLTRAFVDGLDPAPAADTADILALVVSELTTNALRHGGGRYTLELTATSEVVDAAVSDPSPAPPRERIPDLMGGTGGFGWPMVRRLAGRVVVVPGPGRGKTVHARLPRRPGPGDA
ncbi:ATP-binding protein [Streptomyces rochei]|uniref:ATP-binding protein n=1 Tax=Streptomyces TaxID=1883 RepID=UPI001E2BAE74|nr:ATP-binding protein [Streptomyces sp. DH1]